MLMWKSHFFPLHFQPGHFVKKNFFSMQHHMSPCHFAKQERTEWRKGKKT
uniref:Uncharacterized protein n=1 Tax=Arundo donax TaxID=35708 RepID=A0A0A9GR36_ARUDO